jgi:proprotein convertase subtilisin/kexin type 5
MRIGCNSLCISCFGNSEYECYTCAANALAVYNTSPPTISTQCAANCQDGYYINSTKCFSISYLLFEKIIECDPSCLTCYQGSNNNCFECASPSQALYNGQCVNICPAGYYLYAKACLRIYLLSI